ncbi:MAG: dTDP-glucose 4,6-dehydratase [Anaerolineaceae bacterium]|jgi:dTDP-glucose 4,6-dehydratase|nr:dTDP-glucose 4,6-dehydratase [Anaerolineaceae bacterium]
MSENRRLLVTGGAGFIGSNFIEYVVEKEPDWEIVNLDLLTYAGHLENLSNIKTIKYTFIQGDICDYTLVKKIILDHQIDLIVHFAAESHVDRSIEGPGAFVQTNIVGTYNLLEAARNIWKSDEGYVGKRFHHVSTDEVFGMLKKGEPAFTEETPYSPNSPYAASKASSDHLVRAYFHTYGLPITISNCSNNYGPYQFPEKLIPLVIWNAINGKSLPIYGDGQQIRDWLFVRDHCEAILSVIKNGRIGETYNIGGENQYPNLQIVKEICKLVDEKIPDSPYNPHEKLIEFIKDRPGHDFRYDINITKIRNELNWSPKYSLKEGLVYTVNWYLCNHDWTRKILKKPI